MDIIKTGKFIAKLRKDKGLTQEQFGDKIGVTNKTVSRWETGKYLPPADILILMSELFDVSINELLAGQRLSDDEYKQTAENNLTEVIRSSSFTTKDEIAFFKKKWVCQVKCVSYFFGYQTVLHISQWNIINFRT